MLETALSNSRTTLEFIRWKVHNDWIIDVCLYEYSVDCDSVGFILYTSISSRVGS